MLLRIYRFVISSSGTDIFIGFCFVKSLKIPQMPNLSTNLPFENQTAQSSTNSFNINWTLPSRHPTWYQGLLKMISFCQQILKVMLVYYTIKIDMTRLFKSILNFPVAVILKTDNACRDKQAQLLSPLSPSVCIFHVLHSIHFWQLENCI